MFFHHLHPVSELVIVLSDSPFERFGRWEICSIFKSGQIIGAQLAGASVTKTATLIGVSIATVSKVMSTYMNHGKITSAKKNNGQKSSLT
jgi:hypothetical protein